VSCLHTSFCDDNGIIASVSYFDIQIPEFELQFESRIRIERILVGESKGKKRRSFLYKTYSVPTSASAEIYISSIHLQSSLTL